jgi:hypothetical protein
LTNQANSGNIDPCSSCGSETMGVDGYVLPGTKGVNGVRNGVVYSYTLCPNCGGK